MIFPIIALLIDKVFVVDWIDQFFAKVAFHSLGVFGYH